MAAVHNWLHSSLAKQPQQRLWAGLVFLVSGHCGEAVAGLVHALKVCAITGTTITSDDAVEGLTLCLRC